MTEETDDNEWRESLARDVAKIIQGADVEDSVIVLHVRASETHLRSWACVDGFAMATKQLLRAAIDLGSFAPDLGAKALAMLELAEREAQEADAAADRPPLN